MQNEFPILPPSEDLASKVLDRIDDEKLTPRPRWQFSLKNRLLWSLLGLCLLAAAAAAAAMLFALSNTGWEFREVTHDSAWAYFLDAVPFIWVVALFLALLFAYENIRHTKTGYRYPVAALAAFAIAGIVIGGTLLYLTGFGQRVDEEFGARIPLHQPTLMFQKKIWTNPARGLLVGEVIKMEPETHSFLLRTFDGQRWVIEADDLNQRSRDVVVHSHLIRVVGMMVDAGTGPGALPVFRSCLILPWEIHGLSRATISATDIPLVLPERTMIQVRTTDCEGVRPYRILKKLRITP
jgi:hypothetical protein